MKNVTKLTIGNDSTFLTLQVNNNKSKGYAMRELTTKFLAWYDTMRFVGAKTFKANKPLEIKFTVNNKVIFNSEAEAIAHGKAMLKIQNTPQGRKRFEARLERLVSFVLSLSDVDSESNYKERKQVVDCIRQELGLQVN